MKLHRLNNASCIIKKLLSSSDSMFKINLSEIVTIQEKTNRNKLYTTLNTSQSNPSDGGLSVRFALRDLSIRMHMWN